MRALPGRGAVGGLWLGTPEGAEAQLRVSDSMISNESRVREIRTLGSTSGERNVVKVETEALALWRESSATALLAPRLTSAPLLDSTVLTCPLHAGTPVSLAIR